MRSDLCSTSGSLVLARLPKAGLGNKLFVWAEALVFARVYGLPLVVKGWFTPQLRNWWRCGDPRFYWNYFKPWREARVSGRRAGVILQPEMPSGTDGVVYHFSDIPHWSRCFEKLVPHREMIRNELVGHLTGARQHEVGQVADPVICVQVRLGDFRALSPLEDFANVGGVRTPMDYYLDVIAKIRAFVGKAVRVTVVSDGSDAELWPILSLPNVVRHSGRTGIADLILMSRSRLLICAAGSSYSQWGGFLGDGVVLHHPQHFHFYTRSEADRRVSFEGAMPAGDVASWPELLKLQITMLADLD
jgi:hypothetical protein